MSTYGKLGSGHDTEASRPDDVSAASITYSNKDISAIEQVYDLAAMDSKLLTLKGKLGPSQRTRNVTFTLDTAATTTFIAQRLADHYPHAEQLNLPAITVKLPNSNLMSSTKAIKLPYQIRDYSQELVVRVLDMKGYDVILGLDWLIHTGAVMDFLRGVLHVPLHGAVHKLKCDSKIYELEHTLSDSSLELFTLMDDVEPETLCAIIRDAPGDSDLPTSDIKQLQDLIIKNADIFRSELPHSLPIRESVEHAIETGDSKPTNAQYYRLNVEQLEEQKKQVTQLLDKGLIRESSSPWGSPVLFVPKPRGKWRMCVDYRALNKATIKNNYPLPRIEDCLESFRGARIFSKLDLTSGFWQILVRSQDVPKTAFNTRHGKYEFLVMPFGLCNAPATFQTFMNDILRPFLDQFVQVYLDDIVIYSEDEKQHAQHLQTIFDTLKKHGLYAAPSKCQIGVPEIDFCGHHVSHNSIQPMTSKVDVIKTWPMPKTVHQVRQFLGVVGFYRRYVKGFARIATPLQDLLKVQDKAEKDNKHRTIVWNAQCSLAFNHLKDALAKQPVLAIPDPKRPFLIETDASEWAIGGVLYQFDNEGNCHPIAFDGRKLQGAELNYPVHEKELLAIKVSLKKWDYLVNNGMTTTVLTDHQSLQYMNTMTEHSKRLARWVDEFQAYNLDIKYRPGKDAIVPDAISRRPDFIGTGKANISQQKVNMTSLTSMMTESFRGIPEDDWMAALRANLKDGRSPSNPLLKKQLEQHKHSFRLSEQGILLRKLDHGSEAPYLDPLVRPDFARKMHIGYGHFGYPGLLGVCQTRGWWPSMRQDLQRCVHECPECQVSSRSKQHQHPEAQFHQVNPGLKPFDKWAIDVVGPLPATPNENRYIVTAIDYATGWPVAKAMPTRDAWRIAQFIYEEIFSHYGYPTELLSDNGMEFLSTIVEHLLAQLSTIHRLTTPYHPRANGKVENFNGILGSILTKMCVGSSVHDWDSYLPQAVFSCRIRQHRSSQFSPYYLVYGQNPRIPEDSVSGGDRGSVEPVDQEQRIKTLKHARQLANERMLEKAAKAGLVSADKWKDDSQQRSLSVKDWVLIRNESPEKLEPRWYGPLQVHRRHWLGTYALKTPDGRIMSHLVHGDRLIKAHAHSPTQFWAWKQKAIGEEVIGDANAVDTEVMDSMGLQRSRIPTWRRLQAIPEHDWQQMHHNKTFSEGRFGRAGGRPFLVGEEDEQRQLQSVIKPGRPRKTVRLAWSSQPKLARETAQPAPTLHASQSVSAPEVHGGSNVEGAHPENVPKITIESDREQDMLLDPIPERMESSIAEAVEMEVDTVESEAVSFQPQYEVVEPMAEPMELEQHRDRPSGLRNRPRRKVIWEQRP